MDSHGYHYGVTTLNFDGYTMFDFIDHIGKEHGADLIIVDAVQENGIRPC